MPANPRPEIEWTSKQLDEVDYLLIGLSAEVECVRTCLQYLVHYVKGMDCSELHGARYLLKAAMREAQGTVRGWSDQRRSSASTEAEEVSDA